MAYQFEAPVDPQKPLDPKDPPPVRWMYIDYESESQKARYGCKSLGLDYVACYQWEQREKARYFRPVPKKAA